MIEQVRTSPRHFPTLMDIPANSAEQTAAQAAKKGAASEKAAPSPQG